jgi:hypothetical protein
MSIYYRFHHNDFLDILEENLEKCKDSEDPFKNGLISIIVDQPFLFYQSIKNNVPKWFRFHLMDILFDMDHLPNESSSEEILDGMNFRSYDYLDFLLHLINLEIEFKDFINYSSLYDLRETSGTFITLLEKIVIKNVLREFEKFENGIVTKKFLKKFLIDVLTVLNNMRDTKFIIISVNKVTLYY